MKCDRRVELRSISRLGEWKAMSALAIGLALGAALILTLTWGDWERAQAQTPDGGAPVFENMDGTLNELAQRHAMGAFMGSAATANSGTANSAARDVADVGVIFLTEDGDAEGLREFLLENGAAPGPAYEGFIGADVPVSLLGEASRQEGVEWMQASITPRVAGQGDGQPAASEHGADVWHKAGVTGKGVKIGIIAHGFAGFADLGTDLPETVEGRCYYRFGIFAPDLTDCAGEPWHKEDVGRGTRAVQAVYDIAPDATYYVAHINDYIDMYDAVMWMADNGVAVVNNPIMWVWSGPGDGTSPEPLSELSIVNKAVDMGITWLTPAGNDAKTTWFGDFYDRDGDGFHEFHGDDDCNAVELSESPSYIATVRWEGEWSPAAENAVVKVYLVNEDTGRVVSRSYRDSAYRYLVLPVNYLYTRSHNYYPDGTNFCVKVGVVDGDAPDWIQLQSFYGEELEHHTLNGSIASPAESDNPGLLAVGAADLEDTDTIWEHSSQGPTPDGRIKPDIVGGLHEGETFVATAEDEEYTPDTGHEAAHAAGLAALVKQRFPDFGPVEVANYLRENADDRGEPGPDNTWGYGFAALPDADVEAPPDGECIIDIDGDVDMTGTWGEGCESSRATPHGATEGRYARFYIFTLDADTDITAHLESDDVDTYLYLMEGAMKNGKVVQKNDDMVVSSGYASHIEVEGLAPGKYTIEATTYYAGETGDFRLTVDMEAAE